MTKTRLAKSGITLGMSAMAACLQGAGPATLLTVQRRSRLPLQPMNQCARRIVEFDVSHGTAADGNYFGTRCVLAANSDPLRVRELKLPLETQP